MGGEHPLDITEALAAFTEAISVLHHNGKDNLAAELGAVEQTPVRNVVGNQHQSPPPPPGFPRFPLLFSKF